MKSLNLFTTQVFHTDLVGSHLLNSKLLSSIALLRSTDPGVQKSNNQGWHSDDTILLYHPDFDDLRNFVQMSAGEACKELGLDLSLRITNCWVTVSPPGASNNMHTHPGSILSGVYYIQAETGSSPLVVHDPRATRVHCMPPGQPVTPNTASQIALTAATGRLYMFPGWLPHSVHENSNDSDRVVFSFNMVI